MTEQLTNNWLCWGIILLALVCYYQLWLEHLNLDSQNLQQDAGDSRPTNNAEKHQYSAILIGALPLMGLLGTIIGLLDCFAGIANQGANNDLVSSGIGDALLTTQLGLVCAIPGWLLLAWVRRTPVRTRANGSIPALQAE